MGQSIPTWCWYCKKEIPFTIHSCPKCGRTLHDATKVVQCQKCGKFLLLNTPRCIQCGEPTPRPEGWEDPSAAPEPAPPAPAPAEPPAAAVPFPPAAEPQPGAPAPGGPEMMRMFEELEARNKRAAQEAQSAKKEKKGGKLSGKLIAAIAAVLVLAAGAGIYFGVIRPRALKEPKPEVPAYCAEDKHQWIDATCTTPKTCAVCGKTEGAALGHQYVENVCTRCGQPERLFYFSESGSERTREEVIFYGKVENFTGAPVDSLTIGIQLYDENKKLVSTISGVNLEEGAMAPRGTAAWQVRLSDTALQWKYWRVFVEDYAPKP